jgi:hypothetical protein
MNDAFGVSSASAEPPRVCVEEFCPAPGVDTAKKNALKTRAQPVKIGLL